MTADWREAEEEARVLKEGLNRYNEDVVTAKGAAEEIQRQIANLGAEKMTVTKRKEKCVKEAELLLEKIETAEKVQSSGPVPLYPLPWKCLGQWHGCRCEQVWKLE